jgi:hypothetical protein
MTAVEERETNMENVNDTLPGTPVNRTSTSLFLTSFAALPEPQLVANIGR